jgi:hypothetical protein
MADKKISQLPQIFQISGADVFPLVHKGVTHKVALSTIYAETTNYTHSNFLPLSGGTITQDLTIVGNLSVDGSFTIIDTAIAAFSAVTIDTETEVPALRITQRGSGDVLRVEDSNHPDASPFFIDSNGNVGINTDKPLRSKTDCCGDGFERSVLITKEISNGTSPYSEKGFTLTGFSQGGTFYYDEPEQKISAPKQIYIISNHSSNPSIVGIVNIEFELKNKVVKYKDYDGTCYEATLLKVSSQGYNPLSLDTKICGAAKLSVSGYARLSGSVAEGDCTTANGKFSHSEGYWSEALGDYSHSEGKRNEAFGEASHAEGENTKASGQRSHAQGYSSRASGEDSFAGGRFTLAAGKRSIAQGDNTVARGENSFSAGHHVEAAHDKTWIWKGSSATSRLSTTKSNQFMVSAEGGSVFYGALGVGTDSAKLPLTVNGAMSASGTGYVSALGVGTESVNFPLTVSGTLSASGTAHVQYGTFMADTTLSKEIGGAPSQPASVWKSKTINEVLDMILFPDQLASYIVPTLSLNATQSGLREVGEIITQNLTLNGTKNDAGRFTSLSIRRNGSNLNSLNNPTSLASSDLPTSYGFPNPNNPNASYSLSHIDNNFVIPFGTTTWDGAAIFNVGLAKQNNKGVFDSRPFQLRSTNAPQQGGSFSSNSVSIEGAYVIFYGVVNQNTPPSLASIASSIQSGTATSTLISSSSQNGTITITFNANNQFIWFAVQSSYTEKKRWYVNETNQSNIGDVGSLFLPAQIQNVNSPSGRWSNVPYRIYMSAYPTTTQGQMQLRNG